MEEVMRAIQEESKENFIDDLYEESITNELNICDFDDLDDALSIVCPFCRRGNFKVLENEEFGECVLCGVQISLYSSIHNRIFSLSEIRNLLADFFDQHENGTCSNLDNYAGQSHLQITCLNHKAYVTCLACHYSGTLF